MYIDQYDHIRTPIDRRIPSATKWINSPLAEITHKFVVLELPEYIRQFIVKLRQQTTLKPKVIKYEAYIFNDTDFNKEAKSQFNHELGELAAKYGIGIAYEDGTNQNPPSKNREFYAPNIETITATGV